MSECGACGDCGACYASFEQWDAEVWSGYVAAMVMRMVWLDMHRSPTDGSV